MGGEVREETGDWLAARTTSFRENEELDERVDMSMDIRAVKNGAHYVLAVVALLSVWACAIAMFERCIERQTRDLQLQEGMWSMVTV